jgi:hypothetical protein
MAPVKAGVINHAPTLGDRKNSFALAFNVVSRVFSKLTGIFCRGGPVCPPCLRAHQRARPYKAFGKLSQGQDTNAALAKKSGSG